MVIVAALGFSIAFILLVPAQAFAWGPVTHIALGVQVLATVITPDHPLQALLNLPEVFLYGSLAPDIVQGRRLQSRLRRHSHNWATGTTLLASARTPSERAFAYGYMAHLAADVVAHNFFLPARFIGSYSRGIASHIYNEARFDSLYETDFRDLMLQIVELDFAPLDAMLDRAIDSPLIPFSAHRRIFEQGLKRIRQWERVIRALGGKGEITREAVELFENSSREAIGGFLKHRESAQCCRFDPMGQEAIQSALASRRKLQRLDRIGADARKTARELAHTMVNDLNAYLKRMPFGAPT